MDLLGDRGDPVDAAVAGIMNVSSADRTCTSSSAPDVPDVWMWIDHSAGVVSRQHHLDSIAVADGALVMPTTCSGMMGSTGDLALCTTTDYLRFGLAA